MDGIHFTVGNCSILVGLNTGVVSLIGGVVLSTNCLLIKVGVSKMLMDGLSKMSLGEL